MASRAMKIDHRKSTFSEPPSQAQPQTQTMPYARAIEARAYELWVQRGCPIGTPEIDWYQAEEELRETS